MNKKINVETDKNAHTERYYELDEQLEQELLSIFLTRCYSTILTNIHIKDENIFFNTNFLRQLRILILNELARTQIFLTPYQVKFPYKQKMNWFQKHKKQSKITYFKQP